MMFFTLHLLFCVNFNLKTMLIHTLLSQFLTHIFQVGILAILTEKSLMQHVVCKITEVSPFLALATVVLQHRHALHINHF